MNRTSSAVVLPLRKKPRSRRSAPSAEPSEARATARHPKRGPEAPSAKIPYLLDFYPLQDGTQTRLASFFEALRQGRFTTTRCRKDGKLLWPPRSVCPICHTQELEWVDLPRDGRIYAFSALLTGAPLGMEAELPIVVGLIELTNSPLRMFGRIVGIDWRECRIGQRVVVEPVALPDGRSFYHFRAVSDPESALHRRE